MTPTTPTRSLMMKSRWKSDLFVDECGETGGVSDDDDDYQQRGPPRDSFQAEIADTTEITNGPEAVHSVEVNSKDDDSHDFR